MRWATLWLSTALVMAATALHLTIEQDLLGVNTGDKRQTIKPIDTTKNTTSLGSKEIFPKDIHGVSIEELVDSGELNSKETVVTSDEQTLLLKSKETPGSSNSIGRLSKSNEDDNLNIQFPNVVSGETKEEFNSGSDTDGSSESDEDNGQPEVESEGGVNQEPEGSTVEPEGGLSAEDSGGEQDDLESSAATIIDTTSGPVRGHVWRANANIISYIDIKYGTFKSNFEAPVPPDPWENIHKVKDHSKRCPQLQDDQYVGDTDCLTLSIFKPLNAVRASVLFHIHEGNFRNGSGDPSIYGPEYLVSKGIILVLPNYRLGPLGFLCLRNESAQGNAALKDLTLALSWIKANIAKFGGDPLNIAVSGDGTSGALAGYLALSPISKGYVSKVITESGSVLAHWALDRDPIATATNLARNLNDFLSWQDVEASKLVVAAKDIFLRPCLESNTSIWEHFMVDTPCVMIKKQKLNIAFMIGSAMYAGVHDFLQQADDILQQLNYNVELLLPNDLYFENIADRHNVGAKIKSQYFGNSDISKDDVEPLALYFTDAAYLGPGIRTARPLVQSGATVYFYEFSFVGDLNRELKAINRPVEGAVKGDIVGYLFTQDGVVPGADTKERRMVDQLTELWTNFLKTGTPTYKNIEWKKLDNVNETEEQWLSIATETTLKKGLHVDRLRLWTDIYDEHFIERNLAFDISPSVCTVVILQIFFWVGFFKNASHLF